MRRLWLRRAANRSRYESEASLREDLPYDELLALSVLGISVTLQRLELQDAVHGWLTTRSDATLHPMVVCLQERVLENLGIFLPLEIQSAWLEEAKKPWSNTEHAGQPFLLKLVSSFDVEVRNVEILCEMPDAESVPWTFAISTSACVEPLALKQILDPAQCWQAALILKEPGLPTNPKHRQTPNIRLPLDQTCGRQDAKLCMMLSVSGCAGLRISQQQLGMLFRLGHVFVLWDAFLRSLGTSMISAWMKDLEDSQ
eukprot:s1097_g9.t1